jgi:hypothetical protein
LAKEMKDVKKKILTGVGSSINEPFICWICELDCFGCMIIILVVL